MAVANLRWRTWCCRIQCLLLIVYLFIFFAGSIFLWGIGIGFQLNSQRNFGLSEKKWGREAQFSLWCCIWGRRLPFSESDLPSMKIKDLTNAKSDYFKGKGFFGYDPEKGEWFVPQTKGSLNGVSVAIIRWKLKGFPLEWNFSGR